ncbi:DNA-(apurinic or apyrimidinic site) lyase 2 [Ananas comosus]|uniref:DNA-(apurinic or apyrimidinic site) endonuclease 2 n=1 Tax=Ananas comosus TaxID=4615 RepID=A0A6P5H6N3_ANACO|nr:DNA-(apurinic or apyrimidinic site) lyase 2 [Ananas comosus]
MKIVTYNVNGLRQRVAQHGSLRRLLASLDADIICFQETKLSRQDLSADLIMAEGYEAFVSCNRASCRGRTGYSGVATFCRVTSAFSSQEVALPLAAEEGFTGLLERLRNREITRDFLLETAEKLEDLEDITNEDLLKADSEGRCIITDHGYFVIFNIYGPRAEHDDDERVRFKLIFYKILQKRWEFLLAEGKRVFVVGDLNIAPAAIDRCDAEPGFENNMFRKWLRSLLRDYGGSFFDIFRSKHPGREGAYTCFSPRIGAEEFNYGSRIDHILMAGPCLHQDHDLEGHNILNCHVKDCDIMAQFKRGNSDNTPKWKGGRTTKLEGSDHVPVYVVLSGLPLLPVHNTPPLAVRYIPEVRGWQQTIVSFLVKGQTSKHQLTSNTSSVKNTATENCSECPTSTQDCRITSKHEVVPGASRFSLAQELPNTNYKRRIDPSIDDDLRIDPSIDDDLNLILSNSETTKVMVESEKEASLSPCKLTVNKRARKTASSQLTIKSFFQQPKNTGASLPPSDSRKEGDESPGKIEPNRNQSNPEDIESSSCSMRKDNSNGSTVQDQGNGDQCCSLKTEKDNYASREWQRIQDKMKMSLPLCKRHGEPCVPRSVKKGPNIGRLFYVCARAQGPASNPEANCGYFQWASLKSKEKRR